MHVYKQDHIVFLYINILLTAECIQIQYFIHTLSGVQVGNDEPVLLMKIVYFQEL